MTVKLMCTCNNNDFIDMMCRHCLVMVIHLTNEMMQNDDSYRRINELANALLEDR